MQSRAAASSEAHAYMYFIGVTPTCFAICKRCLAMARALTLALLKASSCPAATNSARISWDHVRRCRRRELRKKNFDGGAEESLVRGRRARSEEEIGSLAFAVPAPGSGSNHSFAVCPYPFSTWSLVRSSSSSSARCLQFPIELIVPNIIVLARHACRCGVPFDLTIRSLEQEPVV